MVDVSLLGTGLWAMGQAMALSLVLKMPWSAPPADFAFNPLTRNYATKDGRVLAFTCLQAAKYWPMLCDVIGRPELKSDARFADQPSLVAERPAGASRSSTRYSRRRRSTEWRERLDAFEGQWCVVQDTLEAAEDPQTLANGYLQECRTASGTPFQLVAGAGPVRRAAGQAGSCAGVQRARR